MRKISKITGLFLGLALVLGVGAGIAVSSEVAAKETKAADALSYTLSMQSNTTASDSSSNMNSLTAATDYLVSGDSYVTSVSSSNVYLGNSTYSALKFGSSSKKGSITFTVSTSGAVAATKVVFGISPANDTGKAVNLSLNGATSGTGYKQITTGNAVGTFTDYEVTWDGSTSLSTIKVESNVASKGRFYLQYIKVYVNGGSDVYPTSISCSTQSINVLSTVELAKQVTFSPSGTTVTTLSYQIKSGSDYIDLDTDTGIVTGKKGGNGVVTITPDTTGGASAIDVTIQVSSISAPGITVGDQFVIYAIDETNSYNAELTGVASNLGTVAQFTGDTPACSYVLDTENGYYENSVAFSNNGVYLALNSGSNNLHTSSEISANSSWTVSWDSTTEEAVLTNCAFTTRRLMFNYNNANPRFACYTGGQTEIMLHKYENKSLTDFTIDATASVYVTGTAKIGVTYTPADASDKTLTWASSNTSIVTVDDGTITGVAVGTATVTASKTISGSTVSRTCTVTVLDNVSEHRGTSADPFNINDAVNVANGVFVEDPDGTALSSTGTYYVKGLLTKAVNRTTSTLTFWLGDNDTQVSAATGAFEVFKVATVYSEALGTRYSADSEVVRDFVVGCTVVAQGTFTVYNSTPEIGQGGSVTWNSYIEASTYAAAFNTALEAVCDGESGNTDQTALGNAWSTQKTNWTPLDSTVKAHLTDATAKTNGTDVEKCAAKYDYIVGKYGKTAYEDFMGRNPAALSGLNYSNLFDVIDSSTSIIIIVAVSMISLTSVGAFFALRKRKEF